MLALDDGRWDGLIHAYGAAGDIPSLLRHLAAFPPCDDATQEPYFSLWSALCHQGDVYTASYAALPHIVQMIEAAPDRATWSALLLVASIEIARAQGHGPEIPADLAADYQAALARVPRAVAATATRDWDELFARSASSVLAAVKGQPELAEAILELEPDLLDAFLAWVHER
ncbi:MAG: hypothetical protein MUF84_19165 [Anaerolineae bacterium]|jgi:hypothetical protein|nr:hypothetical protein [Anaerolineae bacterium]